MSSLNVPFHADFVGSFLRPAALKKAREDEKAGKINKAQLLEVENAEVVKLVNKLVELGLKNVSDGEFKRSMWHNDFMCSFLGTKFVSLPKPIVLTASKHIPLRGDSFEIVGKIEYNPNNSFFDSFIHLKSVTPAGVVPKVTIPSPAMYLMSLNFGQLPDIYKDKTEEFFNDLIVAYNKTIKHFYDLGCRYLQLDDTTLISAAGKFDPSQFADPTAFKPPTPEQLALMAQLPDNCVKLINGSIKGLPEDLTITLHICRGNYCSDYFGTGAYDVVGDQLAQLNINGYFLEYDDERSGGFAPLAKIAANGKNQRVVLGVITSKTPELEDEAKIIARIEEAAKFFPKERLCLSAQCGFASCEEGNSLSEDQQWAKLSHIVAIAKKVWGSV